MQILLTYSLRRVCLLSFGMVISASVFAQAKAPAKTAENPAEPPKAVPAPAPRIALTNVRIESAQGTLFLKGVIAWDNGRIVSVGESVPKGDFKVIDGKGSWVYPGLIEPFLNRGTVPPTAPTNEVIDNTTTAPAFMRPLNRNGIRPDLNPEECLDLESVIGSLPESGYTTAAVSPGSGTIRGTIAAFSIRAGKVSEVLQKSRIAMACSYSPGGMGGYPSTEIGVCALFQQTLLDAQRLMGVTGKDAPKEASVLASLSPVMDGRMPIAMIANDQYQIMRTLDFQSQFGFKLWLVGITGANDMPSAMIPKDTGMIVSLTQRTKPNNDGDIKIPDAVFAERLENHTKSLRNFADLEQAGFKPCITASGVSTSQIWTNLRNWVKVGTSKTSILEALTSRPAELLGISDQVGSIAVGKRASLAIFSGDPFEEKTEVKMIVVDGIVTKGAEEKK